MPLLRLRSDEQLVAAFRAGHDDAFAVIHDRYRARLFAYTRQMLSGSRQDAEDALQDVFVRAYGGLRASKRKLALRAWLYKIAHNRCIDELRRPPLPSPELLELSRGRVSDPLLIAEQRDELRRLIDDVRRLPEQQRSALLMRELSDMSYVELSAALDVSVPAVKSLLVRARIGLARAAEARDTACAEIREELTLAHDRGVRPTGTSRRHLRDCAGCREFRHEMRGVTRQLAALAPAVGPLGVIAKVIGVGGSAGGGAAAGTGAVAGGGAAAAGSGGGLLTAGGLLGAGTTHLATLLAAAVITAGGAVELQNTMIGPSQQHRAARHGVQAGRSSGARTDEASGTPAGYLSSANAAASAASAPLAGNGTTATQTRGAGSTASLIADRIERHSGAATQNGAGLAGMSMTVPTSLYPSSTASSGSIVTPPATGDGSNPTGSSGTSSASAGAGSTAAGSATGAVGGSACTAASSTGFGAPSSTGSGTSSLSGSGSLACGAGSGSTTSPSGSGATANGTGTAGGTKPSASGSGSGTAASGSGSTSGAGSGNVAGGSAAGGGTVGSGAATGSAAGGSTAGGSTTSGSAAAGSGNGTAGTSSGSGSAGSSSGGSTGTSSSGGTSAGGTGSGGAPATSSPATGGSTISGSGSTK